MKTKRHRMTIRRYCEEKEVQDDNKEAQDDYQEAKDDNQEVL